MFIAVNDQNTRRLLAALHDFGFTGVTPDLVQTAKMIRMSVPPVRIEILTDISGVTFGEYFARRMRVELRTQPLIYTPDSYQEVNVNTAKLFKTGRSQAVRLPKEYRFEGEEVLIKRVGSGVLLLPKNNAWANLLAAVYAGDDFQFERDQGKAQERDWGDF